MGGGGLTGAQGGIIELSSKGGGAAARRPSIGGGGLAGTQEGSFTVSYTHLTLPTKA